MTQHDLTFGQDGYLMRVQAAVDGDGQRTGRITTWRRTGGNRWEVRMYDLGEWDDPYGDLRDRFVSEEADHGGRHPDPASLARAVTRRHHTR